MTTPTPSGFTEEVDRHLSALLKNEDLDLEAVIQTLGQSMQTLFEEIKSLEYKKRVLHRTSDTLIKVQMMETATKQLNITVTKKNYQQVPELLRVAINFNQFFANYSNAPKIKELNRQIVDIQVKLREYLIRDFENLDNNESFRKDQLRSACIVADTLGESFKFKIIEQFNKEQLAKFKSHKIEPLKLQDQFSWLRRQFIDISNEYLNDIPTNWNILQELSVEFCLLIRTNLEKLLKGLDANELHKALSNSVKFEEELSIKFSNTKNYNFTGLISSCFYDFMKVYVSWVETIQNQYLDRAMKEDKFDLKNNSESAETIFLSIKESFRHVLGIDKGDILFDIMKIWKKNLMTFHSFLTNHLPKAESSGISSYFKSTPVLTERDIITICYIIKSSLYTYKTLCELEVEVRNSINETHKTKVSFQKVALQFQDLYTIAMNLLVQTNLTGLDFDLVAKHVFELTEKPKFESDFCSIYKKTLDFKLAFLQPKLSQPVYTDFGKKTTIELFRKFAKSIKKVKKMNEHGITQIHIDVMSMSDFLVQHVGCVDKGEMNTMLAILEAPVEKVLYEYTEHVEKRNLDEFIWYLDMKGVVKSKNYLIDKFKKLV